MSAAEWLLHELQAGSRIGADPKLMSNTEWEIITRVIIVPSKTIIFMPVMHNLVDSIWPETERPPAPNQPAYVWPEEYAGKIL